MEVSIVTVVLVIGCATLVHADWRPGPAGKQKITSIIIGIALKVARDIYINVPLIYPRAVKILYEYR